MEVEEVQSRSASVVHRNGQKHVCGSRQLLRYQARSRLFLAVVHKPHLCLPVPVDIPATATAAAVRTTVPLPVPADVPATAPDAEALTAELLICGESECDNQLCIPEPGQTTTGMPKFCYHTRYYHTPVRLEYGSKTRLKPLLLSPPYGIPPGVLNNLKSQTTTHFITGGTVYTTPPRYTNPGDRIPRPKIYHRGYGIPCHIR